MTISARKTKIISTLGPASSSTSIMERLIQAGVDLFRLNFSHGSNESKSEVINRIRMLSAAHNRPIGILADLQGPKIRTGRMEGGNLLLLKGTSIDITTDDTLGRPGL